MSVTLLFINSSLLPSNDSYLPPTEDISSFRLSIAVTLIIFLTVAICGNASHLAQQFYSRRFRNGFPLQYFISLLFIVNFMVPFGLPSVILEKLVNIWMFGRFSCVVHHLCAIAGRVLVPWIVSFIHIFTLEAGRSTKFRFSPQMTLFFVLFLVLLTVTTVVPQGAAAQLEFLDHSSLADETEIMFLHTTTCTLKSPRGLSRILQIGCESLCPLCIQLYCLCRVWSVPGAILGRSVMVQLALLSSVQFCCNLPFYFSMESKMPLPAIFPSDVALTDLLSLIPYIVSTVTWLPAHLLSETVAAKKKKFVDFDGGFEMQLVLLRSSQTTNTTRNQ